MKFKSSFLLLTSLMWLGTVRFASAQGFSGDYPSLYHDIKGVGVGDVVTILISESANASKSSKTNNTTATDAGVEGSVNSNLANFLPLFGTSSKISNSYGGQTNTEQQDKLTGKITATIVEETANGMLRLEGNRTLEVNGEKNEIKLKGFVRERDISSDNTVYSWQIANAEITYKKIGAKQRLGLNGGLQKFATWAVGLGLLAVGLGVVVL